MAELVHDIGQLRSLADALKRGLVDLERCRSSAKTLPPGAVPCADVADALRSFIDAGREGHERVIDGLSTAAQLAKTASEAYQGIEASWSTAGDPSR